jgi:biopolymer transport protein ExbB/TolQ
MLVGITIAIWVVLLLLVLRLLLWHLRYYRFDARLSAIETSLKEVREMLDMYAPTQEEIKEYTEYRARMDAFHARMDRKQAEYENDPEWQEMLKEADEAEKAREKGV